MKQRLYKIAISSIMLISVMLLAGCGFNEDQFKTKIEAYLQEEYVIEFEVLSMKHSGLFPTDNGAIYATCIAKNDSEHPFEGGYFYPEEPNAEIEILDNGYA